MRLDAGRLAMGALLALAATGARAQGTDGVVRGSARDQRNDEPVARATIRVEGTAIPAQAAITGDDGRFLLRLAPGPAILRITALGYQAQRLQIAVRSGETTDVAFALVVAPLRLGTVRVEAHTRAREDFQRSPESGTFPLAGSALQTLPVIGEPDVLRAAQLLPGVTTRSDFTAGYNVRGGESDQNLVLLDGIPVYNPFHLGGLFGTFIDETVAEVNLLTGAFPSPYGGRLSSVLDVTSADESRQGVHGAGSLSLLAGSVSLGGALPNATTTWGVAARRTYVDALAGAFTRDGLPYHFQDAQLRLRQQLPKYGSLAFTAYAGTDVLDGTFAQFADSASVGSGRFAFDWGNQLAGVTWIQPLLAGMRLPLGIGQVMQVGDSAHVEQRLSVTRFATHLDLGGGSLLFDNQVQEARYSGALTWYRGTEGRRIGYEVAQIQVKYDAREVDTQTELFALEQRPIAVAAYFDDLIRVNRRLLLRLGARGETVTGTNWVGLSPRASLKFFVNDDLALTAAGGRFTQWMHAVRNEDVPIRIFDFWVASDRYIPVSTADHVVLGGEKWFGATRFLRIEAYDKELRNIPQPNPADDPRTRGDEFFSLRGRSYGVDVLLRQFESERLGGWIAYSYGVSSRERPGESFFPAQDRRHTLNAVASYRTRGNYLLGARLGLASGSPFTDIEGQLIRRQYDGATNGWDVFVVDRQIEPVGGARNARRYPSFQRLDLSVSRAYRLRRTTLTPFLSVVNAYNRKNVFVYTFDYTGNPPTRKATSQFPILPSVGVTVEF